MPYKSKHLHNRRIWITGASSGIGAALAKNLSAQGATLILSGRNSARLEALQEEIKPKDAEHHEIVVLDVTQREEVIAASERVCAAGPIHWVIANAGNCEYLDVAHYDASIPKRMMEVNFFGVLHILEAALPALRQAATDHQPALFAATSSLVTYCGLPRAEAYGASKAAVNYFLSALAGDLWRENIRIVTISPGFVATPLTDRNDFAMPWLMDVDRAAHIIVRGLMAGKSDILFPRRLMWLLRFVEALPSLWRRRLINRLYHYLG